MVLWRTANDAAASQHQHEGVGCAVQNGGHRTGTSRAGRDSDEQGNRAKGSNRPVRRTGTETWFLKIFVIFKICSRIFWGLLCFCVFYVFYVFFCMLLCFFCGFYVVYVFLCFYMFFYFSVFICFLCFPFLIYWHKSLILFICSFDIYLSILDLYIILLKTLIIYSLIGVEHNYSTVTDWLRCVVFFISSPLNLFLRSVRDPLKLFFFII